MVGAVEPGQTRVGHLVDGAATPHQAATLIYEPRLGPLLSVPYIKGQDQFAHSVEWFDSQRPPEALLFSDDRGVVTLTGLRWRGHTGNAYRVGRLSPSATFHGCPRQRKDSYHLRAFTSQIDGLVELTNVGSVEVNEPLHKPSPSRHSQTITALPLATRRLHARDPDQRGVERTTRLLRRSSRPPGPRDRPPRSTWCRSGQSARS